MWVSKLNNIAIEALEKENLTLQYELGEISNHLNSYKDRFDEFQKFDHKANKETNEYLCNQIERLTDMLKYNLVLF